MPYFRLDIIVSYLENIIIYTSFWIILHCPTCKKKVSVLEIQHTEGSKDRTGK